MNNQLSVDTTRLLQEIDKKLEVHLAQSEIRAKTLERVVKTIYGNGKAGLVSRVNLLMWCFSGMTAIAVGVGIKLIVGS